jgi:hypothetical protein
MIRSRQKVIKIGSTDGVTIPAKELKRHKIALGDEVEVIIRPLNANVSKGQDVLVTAKRILDRYKKDFQSLAKR